MNEQQKHKPTEYMKLRIGWLRVYPKSPSKRKRHIMKRQTVKQVAENARASQVYKQIMDEHTKRVGHCKRRNIRAKAEKKARALEQKEKEDAETRR